MQWVVGPDPISTAQNNQADEYQKAGNSLRAGARASRIVRVFRIIKFSKVLGFLKDYSLPFLFTRQTKEQIEAAKANKTRRKEQRMESDDVPEKSRVGAAMTDLMNKRY